MSYLSAYGVLHQTRTRTYQNMDFLIMAGIDDIGAAITIHIDQLKLVLAVRNRPGLGKTSLLKAAAPISQDYIEGRFIVIDEVGVSIPVHVGKMKAKPLDIQVNGKAADGCVGAKARPGIHEHMYLVAGVYVDQVRQTVAVKIGQLVPMELRVVGGGPGRPI